MKPITKATNCLMSRPVPHDAVITRLIPVRKNAMHSRAKDDLLRMIVDKTAQSHSIAVKMTNTTPTAVLSVPS